jgi:oligosaccharide repeat unit polymerase
MGSLLLPSGLLLLTGAVLQLRAVRFITYPPVMYCGLWGVALLWLWLAQGRYLPIADATTVIFVLGALAFSVGGILGWHLGASPAAFESAPPDAPDWLVPALTAAVAVLAPFYVQRVVSLVGGVSIVEFLYYLRVRTLDPFDAGIGPLANVVPFAMMCAMASVALPPRTTAGRMSRIALVAIALALAVLTGGQGPPLTLIISMAVISMVRARRVPLTVAVMGTLSAMVIVGLMGMLIRKGSAAPDAPLRQNVVAVATNLQDYSLIGVVAFDRIVDDPLTIPSNGGYLRAFRLAANRFGYTYEIPPLHREYVVIGDGIDTNTYTTFHAYYPEEGLAGSLALLVLFGVIASFVHRRAVAGGVLPLLFHGLIGSSVMLTTFSEAFYTNLSFGGKLAAFSLALSLIARCAPARTVPENIPRLA